MAIAACDVGPGTVTIDNTVVLTLGPPVGGLESDIALLTPDSLVVPADAVVTSLIPYIKGTSIEVTQANMNDIWGFATTAVAVTDTDGTAGEGKNTVTDFVVLMTTDAVTYQLNDAIPMDFGEITAEKGDYVKCDFTFKGLSPTGSGAAATLTNV